MSLDPAQLEAAIERNDAAAVRELLRDATETNRRACAKALRSLLDGPDFSEMLQPVPIQVNDLSGVVSVIFDLITGDQDREQGPWDRRREQWHARRGSAAFIAASLGLAGGVAAALKAAANRDHWYEPSDDELDAIAGVLADRRPPWLAEFARRKLQARFDLGPVSWTLTRTLVRMGAIDRPDIPEYTTKMPAAMRLHRWAGPAYLLDRLLADPGLLDEEVWRLFTVPDAANWLVAWQDGAWEEALVTLSERGRLDRGRLLDACLDAFTRDFAPNRVGWYVTFHDRMDPSLDEMAARSDRYLRLLAVGAKPGVSLGQEACDRLLEAGRLPLEDFLAASGPALLFPQKSVATTQLKLVGKVAGAQPAVRARALATAARAFGHERLDIQQAALKLIARHGVPGDPERAVIAELAASLAPALGREAAALGLQARPPARPAEARAEVRGTEPEPGAQLPPPLEDPAELIQLLTQLMEDASDPLAVERAMAGAVRLAVLPAAERARLAAPLLGRAGKRLREDYDGPFSGYQIASDLAALTLAWGSDWSPEARPPMRPWGSEDRESVQRSGRARTMAGILSARIWEASMLAAGGHRVQLLAEPEFESGAISPERLLDRLASWAGRSPLRHDLEVALLRLTPGVDGSFWSRWAKLHPTSMDTARQAYEQSLARVSFALEVGGRPQRFTGGIGPDDLRLAPTIEHQDAGSRCWWLLTAQFRPGPRFRRGYGDGLYMSARSDAVVASWPLLCPWQPELAAAHLLRPLSAGLVPGSAWAGPAAAALHGLARSGHPLGPVGHLALLTGLASGEPYVRIAAAEVWAQASLDGRLDPEFAADAIVSGVNGEAFKLNRVADGLRHASHEPAAADRIVQAVFAAADRLVRAKPANLHLLFELAAGIATATPEPPASIIQIANGRSRLAAAARLLTQG